MRTMNRRLFDALDRLLVLCEEYREPLEAMPLGKTFLDELRQSVSKGADYFKSDRGARFGAEDACGPGAACSPAAGR